MKTSVKTFMIFAMLSILSAGAQGAYYKTARTGVTGTVVSYANHGKSCSGTVKTPLMVVDQYNTVWRYNDDYTATVNGSCDIQISFNATFTGSLLVYDGITVTSGAHDFRVLPGSNGGNPFVTICYGCASTPAFHANKGTMSRNEGADIGCYNCWVRVFTRNGKIGTAISTAGSVTYWADVSGDTYYVTYTGSFPGDAVPLWIGYVENNGTWSNTADLR